MTDILLVKTSSLGDVIHNLPVTTDLARHLPGVAIDWVVEEAFAGIPRLHPAIRDTIPVAVRRWRKNLFQPATWREIAAFRRRLRQRTYDTALDSQGLVKSALITASAHGVRCGYDRASAREPLAARFYHRRVAVDRSLHAVERNRLLAAAVFGYTLDTPVDYGIATPKLSLPWLPAGRYAVLLHATSREDKQWQEENWIALGAWLARQGLRCVLPWGSKAEKARSDRLAAAMPDAVVPPPLALDQLATLLGKAAVTVGVDTGLTHLAAALRTPVVALYCASHPGLTGVYATGFYRNLGDAGQSPSLNAVQATVEEALA
ncbi:MAG: lipopolysaccharide heptosyltransferase I [Sulfuricellaceae bacterium]|jgi:heptosyltransferase-1